jgi:hypothetical protein
MQWGIAPTDGDSASGMDKLVNVAVGQTAPAAVPQPEGYSFASMDQSQAPMSHHQWGQQLIPVAEDQYTYSAPSFAQHTPQPEQPDGSRQRRPSVRMIQGAHALQGLSQALAESAQGVQMEQMEQMHLHDAQAQVQTQAHAHAHALAHVPTAAVPIPFNAKSSTRSKARAAAPMASPEDASLGSGSEGGSVESRSAKAKETHRQAEQRRRLQQIEAATELKKVRKLLRSSPTLALLAPGERSARARTHSLHSIPPLSISGLAHARGHSTRCDTHIRIRTHP